MNEYKELLNRYDLKATPQRIAIIDGLKKCGHADIDTLYEVLMDKFGSVSLATVYKNINAMVEKNFVKEVKVPLHKTLYELVGKQHSHLYCKECGKIEDIDLSIDCVLENLKDKKGFEIRESELIFSGICRNCQQV
jgi:Fur family peroxide stress response transcriptional regulator